MERIYLDYAAATPVDPEVTRAMAPYFSERFGNPGSLHAFGQDAIAAVDRSRETIARAVGADFRQILFAGSATEANNLALRGAVRKFREMRGESSRGNRVRPRVIVSAVEHESVLETVRDLVCEGAEAVFVPVNAGGTVDLRKIKESLTRDTAVVSVMYANNEIGTVEPIAEIARIIAAFRAAPGNGEGVYPLFHTDAAQAFQFLDCDVNRLGVDLMTISSHKIYGPKGIGALYVRDANIIEAVTTGGGQEFGLRSGTENVPAIVGFAKAVELAAALREKETRRIGTFRDELWEGIREIFPKAEMNGQGSGPGKLPSILNVYFPGYETQDLLTRLDLAGLAASSGSACRARAITPSYVIEALGHAKDRAGGTIRFSLGRPTAEREIWGALKVLKKLF